MKNTLVSLTLFMLNFFPFSAFGEELAITGSGLPIPRFASLRSREVNMRTGPGTRYPIEWVLRHEGMPLEITAEYDVWRRVRDFEGAEGWVHQSALSGRRTLIVTGDTPRKLRKDQDSSSLIVAHVDPTSVGKILSCDANWCKVQFNDIKGYLPKSDFWGAYQGEKLR